MTQLCRPGSHRKCVGAGDLVLSFLSIILMSLGLEDSWGVRLCSRTGVKDLCWLVSRVLWLHLVMQQVCFLTWDLLCCTQLLSRS